MNVPWHIHRRSARRSSVWTKDVGTRAALIRVAAAELERDAAHLRVTGTILHTIGMDQRGARLETYSCQVRDMLAQVTGGRIRPPICALSEVLYDLTSGDCNDPLAALPDVIADLYRFIDRLTDQRLLLVLFDDADYARTAAGAALGLQQALNGYVHHVAGVGDFPMV